MNLKLVEWNIHKMKSKVPAPLFVSKRLKSQNADILCLTEYTHDGGIIKNLEENYWIEESIPLSGNQILIAIRKDWAPAGIKVVRATEEQKCYNFLHICFPLGNMDQKLSVIGVRMLSPIDAAKQTPPLIKYLSQLDEPFLCTGDFNIKKHRMSKWFPEYDIGDFIMKKDMMDNHSYVFTDRNSCKITDFDSLDHILYSKDFKIHVEYKWSFIGDDAIYPSKDLIKIGEYWDIKKGYPDHAMLIANISLAHEERG